jgi:hypothetical protein
MLMREHIRRFGQYVLDMDVLPLPLNRQPPRSSWPCDHFFTRILKLQRCRYLRSDLKPARVSTPQNTRFGENYQAPRSWTERANMGHGTK